MTAIRGFFIQANSRRIGIHKQLVFTPPFPKRNIVCITGYVVNRKSTTLKLLSLWKATKAMTMPPLGTGHIARRPPATRLQRQSLLATNMTQELTR